MILWSKQTGAVTARAGLRDRAKESGLEPGEEEETRGWQERATADKGAPGQWSVGQDPVTNLCLPTSTSTRSSGSRVRHAETSRVVAGNPPDEVMRAELICMLQIWGQRLREAMWPAHRPHRGQERPR